MSTAKQGDAVKVHYRGRLEDGTVFDSSAGREPLGFTIGEGEVIPGFEQAVVGMAPGESKTATIDSSDAYGPRREELVFDVPRAEVPEGLNPEVNQALQLRTEDGQTVRVIVTGVSDLAITLDANHPLAGQDLIFDLELVEIGG